jgi:hypothetical protein
MRVQAQDLLICSRLLRWSSKLALTVLADVQPGPRRCVSTLFSCQSSFIGGFLWYKCMTLVIGRTSVFLLIVPILSLGY